ncbi:MULTISPECIES: STAS domain-containing protein [Amycolatopsis]|uniref:STAS domain-containing protein n=1 Tax=Amycolatopsis dongchuanensis TaxID=1070866 RepID=A0ABP9R3W7_9PSEU
MTAIRGPGGITRVLAAGEIDWASVGSLDRALEHEPASDTTALVVDLSRVSFCSSCGLHLLTSLRQRALDAGTPLELVVGSAPVRRVLQGAGLWPLFSIHADHAAALAKLTAEGRL